MKYLKLLLVVVLACVLVLPFAVYADDEATTEESTTEETSSEDSQKVNIYLFRGEGCPHCEEFLEWIDEIKDEYSQYYNLVQYEVWNDEDNAELMEEVADARDEEASGVPYIIIGDKSWNGFADDYKDEITSQIKSEYETAVSDRYDIMKLLNKSSSSTKEESSSSSSDVVAFIVIILVVIGIVFGIVQARKKTN